MFKSLEYGLNTFNLVLMDYLHLVFLLMTVPHTLEQRQDKIRAPAQPFKNIFKMIT